MPNHPDANIIMICTGTGAAPFRAMTERRRRAQPDAPGKLLLFFGARTPEELPYFGPLTRLPKELIDAELVFSRLADRPKEYVQDRIRARSEDVARLLADPDSYFYICGHKRMENGVTEALSDICRAHGLSWSELMPPQAWRKGLEHEPPISTSTAHSRVWCDIPVPRCSRFAWPRVAP